MIETERSRTIAGSRDEAAAVDFHPGTAYIDNADAIEVFAYTRIRSGELVNGVVPVRIPRDVILAYLANFPVAK